MAFYTLFAIAPLVVIVLAIPGLWFGEEAAHANCSLKFLVWSEVKGAKQSKPS